MVILNELIKTIEKIYKMKKNLFNQLVKGLILVTMITSLTLANAQDNNISYKARYAPLSSSGFELSIQNITQPTDRTIEFDVYLLDKDPLLAETFELSSAQLGIFVNKGISTGTFSLTMNNTGSGLIASGQQFPNSSIVNSVTSYPDKVLIRVSGKAATAGSGAIISKIGFGTFLSHFTVTSTSAWVASSTPNFEFLPNTATTPLYATRVNQFIGTTDTQLAVTPGEGGNAKVYGNPVLNLGTGIDDNNIDIKINIFSANKNIYIDYPGTAKQISIYNMLGSVVLMKKNVTGLRKINMNNLPNECYIVKVITDNNVTTRKVLLK